MYFFIEDEELLKNIMTFAKIKSPIVWKKNLIGNPSTTKIFWIPK